MLLPAFQPLFGQARSSSMSTPRWMRYATLPWRQQGKLCLSASEASAVGTTQLHVPGSQGQPNLSGSNRTRVSVVRNFHFQIQLASRPWAASSQSAARLAACGNTPKVLRVNSARAVSPDASSSVAKDPQLPSGRCASSKTCAFADGSVRKASSAKQVGSDPPGGSHAKRASRPEGVGGCRERPEDDEQLTPRPSLSADSG